jgi:hypothetical protein
MAPKPEAKGPLDKAWEHCVRVVPDDEIQVKCRYRPTTMYGGINMMKHHLARVVCKNATICDGCLVEVRAEMQVSLQVIKDQNTKRARTKFEVRGIGRSQMAPPVSWSSNVGVSPSISSPFFLPQHLQNPSISTKLRQL